MKKFICQFTLCLALLSLFCSAIPAKAIVTGNTSSYDITLEEITKVNKLNNINTEETVEVFSHGQEKIYITQDDIEIISPLDLYLNHSNLIIHPFLGIIKESTLKNDIENLLINKDEVDHVFSVPITYLLDSSPEEFENEVEVKVNENFPYSKIPNKENYKFAVGKYSTLFYEYKNYIIWGITAKILENFLNFIKE